MDDPDPTTAVPWQTPAHVEAELQLLYEFTRLSKSLVDLTAVANRQLSLIVSLQHENASLRQGFGELRHEVDEVRVAAQLGVRGHESRAASELRERLVWYPAWSAQAPLSSEPLVSVIISTRNRRPLLEAALDSLLGQTYGNWEAVIASIHLPFATERKSRRPDHYRSEEDVRSHSARRRCHDDRFVTATLRSTRSASSREPNSLLPTMTRLDGEILVLVLIALSRRFGNSTTDSFSCTSATKPPQCSTTSPPWRGSGTDCGSRRQPKPTLPGSFHFEA